MSGSKIMRKFKNSGFLNLDGMDLQTMMGYSSPSVCDRTVESDRKAVNEDTNVFLSTELFAKKIGAKDGKGLYWTDDMHDELPIKMTGTGLGRNLLPQTLTQAFLNAVQHRGEQPALRVQRGDQELMWTWQQYRLDSFAFAKSLHKLGVEPRAVVNIMGFNCPELVIAIQGTYLNNGVVSGVYSTNNADACQYQSQHSECQAVIVETLAQFEQYVGILPSLPRVKALVVWGEKSLPDAYKSDPRFHTWDQFLNFGTDVPDSTIEKIIAN